MIGSVIMNNATLDRDLYERRTSLRKSEKTRVLWAYLGEILLSEESIWEHILTREIFLYYDSIYNYSYIRVIVRNIWKLNSRLVKLAVIRGLRSARRIAWFQLSVVKPKPPKSLVNQTEFEEITCNQRQVRENARVQLAIGFAFQWLKWHTFCQPVRVK